MPSKFPDKQLSPTSHPPSRARDRVEPRGENLEPFQEPHRNLYVANFGDALREEEIEDLFSAFCEVRRVVMKDVMDRASGELKGHYAFVWTGSVEQATCAKNALHNVRLGGKKLQVKFAREGSFKITSMTITTDAQGNANRKMVTLRSDLGEDPRRAEAKSAGTGFGPLAQHAGESDESWHAESWEDEWAQSIR
jgi:RNA recognition motif-containing protein